jgi:PEGA domain
MTEFTVRKLRAFLFSALLFLLPANTYAQNQVQGQVTFTPSTKAERSAGVWIDGQYVGYVDELKDENKVLLLPGEHEISIRLTGYKDLTQKVIVEPGKILVVKVRLDRDPQAHYSQVTAEVKLEVTPDRAAVFVDDTFVGHAGEFGGVGRGMLVSPGKHRIKIALAGYQTFETDVSLVGSQKTQIKTDLVKGSITQTSPLIKNP